MADRGQFPNIATLTANQSMLTSLVSGDTVTVAGVVYTWDGTGWGSPTPSDRGDWSKTPSGALVASGPLTAPNIAVASYPIRVAIEGDSIAENKFGGGFLDFAIAMSHGMFTCVANTAVGGSLVADVDARIGDLAQFAPDEVWINPGINDMTAGISPALKDSYLSIIGKIIGIGARPVIFLPNYGTTSTTNRNKMAVINEWITGVCERMKIECNQLWDHTLAVATGNLDPAQFDALAMHPIWSARITAASKYLLNRIPHPERRMSAATGLYLGKWVADPFNTTGTGTQASRWTSTTATGGATVTWSKSSASYPDIGTWQRIAPVLPAVSLAGIIAECVPNSGILLPAGDIEVSYRIKCANFVNLNLRAYLEVNPDSGSVDLLATRTFHGNIRGDFDGTIHMTVKVPANAYRPWLRFSFTQVVDGVAASGDVDVAMISIKSLAP